MPGMSAPFLILQTGRPTLCMRRHGEFAHWIRVGAGLRQADIDVVNVEAGAALPARNGYAGVFVTGSPAMVTDHLDWSERSADWLREAAHAGLPILGICYGHQLLAYALGGTVADNPQGRELGTVRVQLAAEAADDPLLQGVDATMSAQVSHMQSVLQPPSEARVLAFNAHDACQAFRWGRAAWGVQFHPEFSTQYMRGYILARSAVLAEEGRNMRDMLAHVRAAPHARRVLRRFVRHARR